jgi:hypothetical protein
VLLIGLVASVASNIAHKRREASVVGIKGSEACLFHVAIRITCVRSTTAGMMFG